MGQPALILAALAADAAPGKNFTNFKSDSSNPAVDQLLLWDRSGDSYVLKAPANPTGERELALELEGIRTISEAADLPFETPKVVGSSRDLEGNKAVLLSLLGGQKPDLSRYTPGKFSESFAKAMSAVHSLSPALVRDAGLPEYQPTDLVHQRVSEVDRIAATGRVAPQLLSRWEQALEDVAMFRFHPTVIHGAISEESLVVSGQEIIGISSWNAIAIADPAEDFRWLAGGALQSTFEDALLHYRANLPVADENLALRATLYAELELGNWLVYCLETGDEVEIARAEDLLNELRDQLDAGTLSPLRATSFAGITPTTTPIPEATKADDELF